MDRIFNPAKTRGFEVFISPHYFYPTDKGWKFNGALETDDATSGMFARKGVLNLDGLQGSGADWLKRQHCQVASLRSRKNPSRAGLIDGR